MLFAIHKETGKEVSAEKVISDSSWIGTQKDEWICPEHYIYTPKIERINKGIQDIKMCFVNSKERRVHFRRITEGVQLLEDVSESYEHKTAKEKIYELLWNRDIKFLINNQIKTLDDFKNFDIFIEERIGTNGKIADVLVRFDNKDNLMNKGIVFEIQFSKQSKEDTDERTWVRVFEGYTVVWLWKQDFDNEMNLKGKTIKINSYNDLLEEYKKFNEEDLMFKIKNYSRKIDGKIIELKSINKLFEDEIEFKKRQYRDELKKEFDERISEFNNQGQIFTSQIEEKFKSDIKHISIQKSEELKKELESVIPKLKDDVINEVSKSNSLKQLVYEEMKVATKEILKDTLDFNKIKEDVKSKSLDLINESKVRIKEEISEKINNEAKKIIESNNFDICIREKFGITMGEFARTYLDAKIFDLKKELVNNGR